MHARITPPKRGFLSPDWREIGLWSGAGLIVICLHAGGGWYIQNHQASEPAGEIAAAIMIDMEPLPAPVMAQPVIEEAPIEPEEVAPEPVEQEAAAPEPVQEIQPEPEELTQPVEEITQDQPEPDIAEAVAPAPEEAAPLDEPTEEVVELPNVEVPLPAMRPEARNPDAPKKPVEKAERRPERPTGTVRDETPREVTQRPAASSAATARQAAKWQSRVEAYLARRAKRARTSGEGTVSVRFVVTRQGDIVSASVVGSSGSPQLDQSVLDTVRRASPVPSAPDEVTVSRQSFTVPFRIQ
ncbi:TonB family protein [Phyllobacterium lublinensis]|uniref:TonB family protein n=1 Tax=Phyllobacterium lublinensis TaxID=2875708 RepID=UPI001CCC6D0E|nr:TonB family protein [Phyllobacterium sp. 2063]MBZ9656001.1 TonB family protein [Phyllobacterium sp. 2063]